MDPDASSAARLGAEIRTRRQQRGLTLQQLAGQIGFSAAHLSAVELAAAPASEQFVLACEGALDAAGVLLALLPAAVYERASRRHRNQARRRWGGELPGPRSNSPPPATGPAGMEGRALPQPPWGRIEATTLDGVALEELAATVASHARLHDRLGSRAVHGLVVEHVRLATDLLRGNPPPTLRPRLAAVASEAAAEAGLVCHDQRQFAAAESYYQLAGELAREAGDFLLEAYALGSWSKRLTDVGGGARALSFVESACAAARRRPSPATSAYLAMAEAAAQAGLGDAHACLRALARADEARERQDASEGPPWLVWLEDAHFAGWKGYCHLRLGRLGEAEALIGLAVSTWDPSFARDRAIILMNLAFVRRRQDEADECCRLAMEALEVAVATGSPRVAQQLRDLRAELQPWSQVAAVKALGERMVAESWV